MLSAGKVENFYLSNLSGLLNFDGPFLKNFSFVKFYLLLEKVSSDGPFTTTFDLVNENGKRNYLEQHPKGNVSKKETKGAKPIFVLLE